MRRPQELVDRQQFLQPVSAVLQGARVAREAAGIARGVDHARHLRRAPVRPICAAAPARGGSSTTASKASSSAAVSGLRKRSRRSAVTVAAEPARRRLDRRNRRLVALEQRQLARPARATARPTPAKRSASLGASPIQSLTAARIACSARLVACRKAPGGGSTVASPKTSSGWRRDDDRLGGRTIAPAQPRQVRAFGQRHQRLRAVRATGRGACAAGPARRRRCRSR